MFLLCVLFLLKWNWANYLVGIRLKVIPLYRNTKMMGECKMKKSVCILLWFVLLVALSHPYTGAAHSDVKIKKNQGLHHSKQVRTLKRCPNKLKKETYSNKGKPVQQQNGVKHKKPRHNFTHPSRQQKTTSVKAKQKAKHVQVIFKGQAIDRVIGTKQTVESGQTKVPLRELAERLGYRFDWNEKKRSIVLHRDDSMIQLMEGQKKVMMQGKTVNLHVPPTLQEKQIQVPLQFLQDCMSVQVKWDRTKEQINLHIIPPVQQSQNKSSTPTPKSMAMVTGIVFKHNQLTIATAGHVNPTTFVMQEPHRIVLDFPNTTFAEQLVKDVDQTSLVLGIRHNMFEEQLDTARIVIDLVSPIQYTVTEKTDQTVVTLSEPLVTEASGNVEMAPSTTTADRVANDYDVADETATPVSQSQTDGRCLIVIDAGHGQQDSGAIGVTGYKEKDFNLAIALKIEQLLQDHPVFQTLLTRRDDTFIKLNDRPRIAKEANASLFISIHANSTTNPKVTGMETYYRHEGSRALAEYMHAHLTSLSTLSDRGVRKASFAVLKDPIMPSILLEAGYLSNVDDEKLLFSEQFQNEYAHNIVEGIKHCFGFGSS